MPDHILLISQTAEDKGIEDPLVFTMIQSFYRQEHEYYYLAHSDARAWSIFHGTPQEFREPLSELAPLPLPQWRPVAFQRALKEYSIDVCIFIEPEASVLKLIPVSRSNNVKTMVYDRRSFFQACPITSIRESRFRAVSYALADRLIVLDSISRASWICAGFVNCVLAPEKNVDWLSIFNAPTSLQGKVSGYEGFLVFEEAFKALEQQLPQLCPIPQLPPPMPKPVIKEVRIIKEVEKIKLVEVDRTEPWQKALGKLADKSFPPGSLRRKLVGKSARLGWRGLKKLRRLKSLKKF